MILVDTSVWIEVFRRNGPLDLEAIVPFDDIVTCPPVVQEVLQGFGEDAVFLRASSAMMNLPMMENPMNIAVYDLAIELYRSARRRGITVRSSADCLIAACALRNRVEVLHRDRDFAALATVSGLRQRAL